MIIQKAHANVNESYLHISCVEMSLLHSTMMNSADEVTGYVISH